MRASRARGINLMEVMIAVTLFCGVCVALFGVWGMHAKALAKSQDYLVGSALAQQIMENQLSEGWTASNITSQPFVVKHIVAGVASERLYHYQVDVEESTGAGTLGLKHVTVTVTWDEAVHAQLVQRKVIVNTLLSWQG